ncbi:MAG: hypothetical protein QOG53_349 [Frankiales bacterium]|nr:hypothetical protein [Frankiales bacterium]
MSSWLAVGAYDGYSVEPPPRRSRRRLLLTIAVAAAVVAAGIPALLFVGGDKPGAAATHLATTNLSIRLAGGYYPATKSEKAEVQAYTDSRDRAIQAVLDRQSRGVVRHRLADFVSGVDRRSASFLRRQREIYARLTLLDLARWTYKADPTGAYGQSSVNWRGYGAEDVAVLPVVLSYQIRGFDAGAVARGKVFTFVRRGTTWSLASDADVKALAVPAVLSDPWDVGPISVARGRWSLIIGGPADKKLLARVARLEDQAISTVARRWPDKWSHRVVVVVSRNKKLLAELFSEDPDSVKKVAAVAVPQFQVADINAWDSTVPRPVSARVIINPSDLDAATNLEVLTHETVHVATFPIFHLGSPLWMVEGYAEYVSRRPDVISEQFFQLATKNKLPSHLPSNTAWRSTAVGPAFYDEAWLACRFITRDWSEHKLIELYRKLSAIDSTDSLADDAEQRIIRSVLGISAATFAKRWKRYMHDFVAGSNWRSGAT